MAENVYTDEQLFTEMADGSARAFDIFYHRYFLSVLYFSRRYVAETDAEDIAAEAFVQTWQERSRFERLSQLTNYLYVVARNKCHDIIRRQQVRSEHAAALAELQSHGDGAIQAEQVRAEMVRLLYAELGRLPVKTREVFMLSFRDGLKPAEIAAHLGLSVQTVKNQKVTAIRLLREALKDHPLEAVLLFLLFH